MPNNAGNNQQQRITLEQLTQAIVALNQTIQMSGQANAATARQARQSLGLPAGGPAQGREDNEIGSPRWLWGTPERGRRAGGMVQFTGRRLGFGTMAAAFSRGGLVGVAMDRAIKLGSTALDNYVAASDPNSTPGFARMDALRNLGNNLGGDIGTKLVQLGFNKTGLTDAAAAEGQMFSSTFNWAVTMQRMGITPTDEMIEQRGTLEKNRALKERDLKARVRNFVKEESPIGDKLDEIVTNMKEAVIKLSSLLDWVKGPGVVYEWMKPKWGGK